MKKISVLTVLLFLCLSLYAFETEEKIITEKTEKSVFSVAYPKIKGDTEAAKTINSQTEKDMASALKEFKGFSAEYTSEIPWEFRSLDGEITLDSGDFFSYYIHVMSYTGGAHPDCAYYTYSYKIKNGKAVLLTIDNIFKGNRKILCNLISPRLAKERTERISSQTDGDFNKEILADFSEETIDQFTMDGYGINFIFPEYSVGAYAEGEYIISVPWEDLKKAVTDKDLLAYISDPLARNNISGTITLDDASPVPAGAKLYIKLIWIPTNKEPRAIETKKYDLEKGTRKFTFRNSYDWRDKSDLNEYQIWTELYYDGVLAYKEDQICPITGQGWPQDTEMTLEKVYNEKDIMRLSSKLVTEKETEDYFDLLEIRVLDRNEKPVRKFYFKDVCFPYNLDLAVNAKDLNDTYHLNIFVSDKGKIQMKNTEYYPFAPLNSKLPEKIVLK